MPCAGVSLKSRNMYGKNLIYIDAISTTTLYDYTERMVLLKYLKI